MELSGGRLNYRRILTRWAQMKTLSDSLPGFLQVIVNNGKAASLGAVALYAVFLLIWLPIWILSFFTGEWGIYVLSICLIMIAGRSFIRMIAFPGASARVTLEIEAEFARYSVRMIVAATNSLLELATAIDQARNIDIVGHWHAAKQYRDHVLGVYYDVLQALLQQSSSASQLSDPDLTIYGNNRLKGDIGDLSCLTPQARIDGQALFDRLSNTLRILQDLESKARPILYGSAPISSLDDESRSLVQLLVHSLIDLRDFASSLKPCLESDERGEDDEDPADSIRRRIDEQTGGSPMEAMKAVASSILPMLDPPPHTSIFGLDVQRGCLLSRYRGAKQFWVRRPDGGMIDCLHFPAIANSGVASRNLKAVLYCNPNAGLIEVLTGMSLIGGNIMTLDGNAHESWVDFYTKQGFDMYVYNYAGYGRSYGTTWCVSGRKADQAYHPGLLSRLNRIFRSCFLSFTPTPETLRQDGTTVAQHLIDDLGIQQLVIHGESIGGVAASGAGRFLSHHPAYFPKICLLVCDRTFCNLEAVAQRLVGGWSAYAIRALAPFWSSDVAGDFVCASCPKVVANDAADVIISDAASLKAGIALWKELHCSSGTKGIGWISEEPLRYRMADFDNVCVTDTRYITPRQRVCSQPPTWPQDKTVTHEEAFHFAACCKRIGKRAKLVSMGLSMDINDEGHLAMTSHPILQAWALIASTDGLTGSALGQAVKRGFDATAVWLCSSLVFGCQQLIECAERRLQLDNGDGKIQVVMADFDGRPRGYELLENETKVFPKPIPEVIDKVTFLLEHNGDSMSELLHEFSFVIGMFRYIQTRLTAIAAMDPSLEDHTFVSGTETVGKFFNLHCGHNNAFSSEEKGRYVKLLQLAVGSGERVG